MLSLGLPLVGRFPGRVLTVRVLLVGAIVLLLSRWPPRRCGDGNDTWSSAPLVLLVFTAALVVRASRPTGLVLLAIAIGSLLWQRRAWARR